MSISYTVIVCYLRCFTLIAYVIESHIHHFTLACMLVTTLPLLLHLSLLFVAHAVPLISHCHYHTAGVVYRWLFAYYTLLLSCRLSLHTIRHTIVTWRQHCCYFHSHAHVMSALSHYCYFINAAIIHTTHCSILHILVLLPLLYASPYITIIGRTLFVYHMFTGYTWRKPLPYAVITSHYCCC